MRHPRPLPAFALAIAALGLLAASLFAVSDAAHAAPAAAVDVVASRDLPRVPERPTLFAATTTESFFSNNLLDLFQIQVDMSCDDTAVPGLEPVGMTCLYTVTNQSTAFGQFPRTFPELLVFEVQTPGASGSIAGTSNLVGNWSRNGQTFTLPGMAADEVAGFTVDWRFPSEDHYASAGNALSSELVFFSDAEDLQTGLDGDLRVPFTFAPTATLTVDKVLLNDGVAPGGVALFEITVENDGPSDVRDAAVTDTPAGVLAGQPVVEPARVADLDIPANGQATWIAAVEVPDSAVAGDSLENEAVLSAAAVGFTPIGVLTDTAVGLVGEFLPPADMQINKVFLNPPAVPGGGDAIFELTVTNNGPAPAENVLVVDSFFDGNYFVNNETFSTPEWRCSFGRTCARLSPMPAGATEVITFYLRLPSDAHITLPDPVNNRASVVADNPDPATGNNSVSVPVPLDPIADLSVDKTLLFDPVAPGGLALFDVTITNDGPSDAPNVDFTDVWTGMNTPVIAPAGPQTIPAGQSRRWLVSVRVDSSVNTGDTFDNTATIIVPPEVSDPDLLNNDDTETLTVGNYLPEVNLSLQKGNVTAVAGGPDVSVALTVTNPADGSSTLAEGVSIVDLFPVPAVIDAVSAPYSVSSGGTLVRDQPMEIGTTDFVSIFFRIDADVLVGNYLNTAVVTADNPEADPTDNIATGDLIAEREAELSIDKSDLVDPIRAGEWETYLVRVTNLGPSTILAEEILVVDSFQTTGFGIEYAGGSPECNQVTPICLIPAPPGGSPQSGRLEPGETYDLELAFRLPDNFNPANGPLLNEVTADWLPDLIPPVMAEEETRVVPGAQADLKLTKYVKPDDFVDAGETFTYTLFTDNMGPNIAFDLVLEDEMVASGPFEVVDVVSDQGGTCAPTSGMSSGINHSFTISCTLASLGIFDRWTVNVVARAIDEIDVNNVARVYMDDDLRPGIPVPQDINPENNYARESIRVEATSDLEISKVATGQNQIDCGLATDLRPDEVTAGGLLNYSIRITNTGPSFAEGVRVIDRLPPELEVIDATISSGNCTVHSIPDATLLACFPDDLRWGESVTAQVTARVRADTPEGTLLHNAAQAFSDSFDRDNSNDVVNHTTTVNARADLSIVKDDFPDPVVAGQALEYRFTVYNDGLSDAQNVMISDQLDPALRFTGATIDGRAAACTVDAANLLMCALGTLAPNPVPLKPVVVTVNMLVADDTVAASIPNTASIASDTIDPCLANNSEDETTALNQVADLRIRKSVDHMAPVAGQQVSFHVDVWNDGPSDAVDVVVTDVVPDGLIYRNQNDFCTEAAGVITCEVPLAAPNNILREGRHYGFDLVFDVASDVAPESLIANTASVLSATPDPFLANNEDEQTIFIRTEADLRVRKFGKPDGGVRAGELLTYTIIVDNLGPSFAHAVEMLDEIVASELFDVVAVDPDVNGNRPTAVCTLTSPNDPALNVAIPNGGAGAPGAPIAADIDERANLFCTLPDTPDVQPPFSEDDLETFGGPLQGAQIGRWVIEVVVTADQTSDINNVASVSSLDTDPDASNNEAYVEHDITDVADLRVQKSAVGQNQTGCNNAMVPLADNVTAGGELVYTIQVRNWGPSDAENVLIFDRLPPGIVVTDYSLVDDAGAPTGECRTGTPGAASDQLVCAVGLLRSANAAGVAAEGATLTVTAAVDADVPHGTILENDVFVDSDIFDIDNSNNYASNLTAVNARADLQITKTNKGPNPVPAGTPVVYQLDIVNLGKSDAQGVVITDTLPAGLSFGTATNAACYAVPGMPQMVECGLGTVAAGETRTVYLEIDTASDTVPSPLPSVILTNAVEIDSLTIDPCPANNTDTAATPVLRVSDVYAEKEDLVDPVIAGTEEPYRITFGNHGPSDAVLVHVTDTLPLGFTFNRCMPIDPDDAVTCSVISGNGDTVRQVVLLNEIRRNNAVVYSDGGDVVAGAEFGFILVADVESGYVLNGRGDTGPGQPARAFFLATGYPHYASNQIAITSLQDPVSAPAPLPPLDYAGPALPDGAFGLDGISQVGPNPPNNVNRAITRVEGEADLQITKTDIFGDPLANPDNYFLQCDPVQPGGMITYRLEVTNNGASDAAEVVLMDWLPKDFVVVDPVQVMIDIAGDAGLVEEKRDTGKLTVIIGRDVDNQGAPLLGRLNAGNTVRVTIQVMVRQAAECGGVALNRATVTTRALAGPPVVTTPTRDPKLANNEAVEDTTIACPAVAVNKTVSYDGTCPGLDIRTINRTGQPVTFCYEITNTGTTWLDYVHVTDTLRTRTNGMPVIIFTDTIRSGVDPKEPLAPGESVKRQVTVPQLTKECGTATNEIFVSANPVNSGRTDLPCIDGVDASDSLTIDVPCAGLDWRLQLPVLHTEGCEAWIQVQNVGDADTKALLVSWGDPGFCPPQSAGPLKIECTGLLAPGSAWSFAAAQLPAGARSAVVYSMPVDLVLNERNNLVPFADLACGRLFQLVVGSHDEWLQFDLAYRLQRPYNGPFGLSGEQLVLDFGKYQGEPLAATVNRSCPDLADPNITNHAAYIGISSDMEGARDPFASGYGYYAPLVFAGRAGLNSTLHIQNSGIECSSLELWFRAQDNCLRAVLGDVLTVSPGETVAFDPNTVIGPDWLGSAWIRASQPLGIIVETMGDSYFTAYSGVTADISALELSLGNQINYAPLIYSEYQGWDTALQVQNLSGVTAAKVKVYFLDRSGDIITTLVDWICPRGSQTFFLPVIANIPGGWVGSARVESQEWWSPGQPLVDPPRVQSVVQLERWVDPARTARREAVAYNAQTECLLYDWQLGSGKGGVTSGSAVFAVPMVSKGNRGVTTELAITNLVPKPGFTDFVIYLFDQNGLIDFVCEKLNEKQVEYIDFSTWGAVQQNFLGSAVVSATFWEHDVFDNQGGFVRNLVGLGGVNVERIGRTLTAEDVPGDESKAYETFPVFDHFEGPEAPLCPGVPGQAE